jgi:hypothetical protein
MLIISTERFGVLAGEIASTGTLLSSINVIVHDTMRVSSIVVSTGTI